MLKSEVKKRRAVSILLARDPGTSEIYLAERNPKLKFFGGFFAFPGGTLDESDAQVAIENLADAVGIGSPDLTITNLDEVVSQIPSSKSHLAHAK